MCHAWAASTFWLCRTDNRTDIVPLVEGLKVVSCSTWVYVGLHQVQDNVLVVEDELVNLSLKHELAKPFLSTERDGRACLNMHQNLI